MKVTVFGGTGFVGGYLVDSLLEHGHQPCLLVRASGRAAAIQPERCTLVPGDIADPESVRNAVAGADAVIYNIGILREYPAQGVTYEALHFEGARRAIDAAATAGIRRFMLMSANGVRMNGTGYQTTKFRAEQYLANSGLDWTVFRPSVIFGDPRGRMEFATQLYREVICSPLPAPLFFKGLRPTEAGMFRMSPVHVRDVATAFVQALDMPGTVGHTYTLGGPENPTWKAILRTIAHACGYEKSEKPVLPVPALALHGLAALLDRYAFFPVTRDQLTMLLEGNVCDGRVAFDTFGIEPVAFAAENLAYLRKAPRFRTAP